MTLLLALLFAMLLMAWQRQLHLGLYRVVRTRRKGWMTAELRYRDFLIAPHREAFPEPREERLVVWRLLGCVIYVRRRSVALPSQCDARINHISERDFDARFENDFRLTAW